MIAAGQWQPVILESGLPGGNFQKTARERELVARALRPPPPTCFMKQEGPLATRSSCGSVIARARIGSSLRQKRHSFRALSGSAVAQTGTGTHV
jgi:hypothetical protein